LRWLGEGGLFKCALPRAVVLVVPSYGDVLRNVSTEEVVDNGHGLVGPGAGYIPAPDTRDDPTLITNFKLKAPSS
jgi:hypothetical protein